MNMNARATVVLTLLITLGSAAWAAGVTPMGQVVSNNLAVDGLAAPMGSTLLSPSLVSSSNEPGQMRLNGDYSVVMDRNSKALFQASESGAIQVNVETGSVAILSATGQETLLAENSVAMLDDDQGGLIGEGEAVPDARLEGDPDEELDLCELQDATQELVVTCHDDPDDDDCEWDRIEVKRSELEGFLMLFPDIPPGELGTLRAAVFAEDNDMGVRCRVIGVPVLAALGTGAAIALGEILSEDTVSVISPVTPQQ